MKKSLIALAVFAVASFAVHAEENPAVAIARDANTAIGTCITAMSSGIAGSNLGTDAKTLMLNEVPAKCKQSIVMAQVRQGPGTGEMVWDGFKFAVGLWAQYKGQALIWNGLQAMMSRQADSTDNAVDQGFNTANTSVEALSGVTGQVLDKLPAPPAVGSAE
jgi:hypothetical protein